MYQQNKPMSCLYRWGGLLVAFIVSWSFVGVANASSLDTLKREARALERARDCEGAYKKYEELRESAKLIRSSQKRRRLLAFIATKLLRLEKCYKKCVPNDNEKLYLEKAKEYRDKRQKRRAYRILLRLLRGKNPRCSSWKEAHQWRKELGRQLKRRRHQQSVDPCDIDDDTKQKLANTKREIASLQSELFKLQADPKMPAPPRPPRWARKGRKYRWWLRRWKRRTRRRMRRKARRTEMRRLQKILVRFRKINVLRERVFNWRENFQNCDEVYVALKAQSATLKRSQQKAHQSIVGLYDGRMKRFQRSMRWFSRKYYRLRRNQKTDRSSVASLHRALQQQRELIDTVTQDLMAMSNLLVFKPKQAGEGTVLQNNMGNFQRLMNDQKAMFATLQKRYPGFMKSGQGRKQVQQHLSALEKFEKVLERFQDRHQGDKGSQIQQTLNAVRGSILLLEKADKTLAKQVSAKDINNLSAASLTDPDAIQGQNKSSFSWGWVFLGLGLLLALGASFYLWKERKKSRFGDSGIYFE